MNRDKARSDVIAFAERIMRGIPVPTLTSHDVKLFGAAIANSWDLKDGSGITAAEVQYVRWQMDSLVDFMIKNRVQIARDVAKDFESARCRIERPDPNHKVYYPSDKDEEAAGVGFIVAGMFLISGSMASVWVSGLTLLTVVAAVGPFALGAIFVSGGLTMATSSRFRENVGGYAVFGARWQPVGWLDTAVKKKIRAYGAWSAAR